MSTRNDWPSLMPRGIVTLKSGVARVCVELDAMGGGVVDSKSGEVRPCAELDAMRRGRVLLQLYDRSVSIDIMVYQRHHVLRGLLTSHVRRWMDITGWKERSSHMLSLVVL